MTLNSPTAVPAHTNRLAREKSPYLLQHAHNPVDWFPWAEEAFAKARLEEKPIFLSIGYSTCHWCHVMERESFEDESVAKFFNAHFVGIKVDREERPDVDKIYMTFVQSTTGSGGWPLNVFLTPDLKPFYGGTYFPPDNRHGQPGFLQLLQRVAELWKTRRAEIATSAEAVRAQLEPVAATAGGPSGILLDEKVLRDAGPVFKASYDPQHGGFGHAPKFPQPSQPGFLLRYALRFKDDEALGMVLHTCDSMAAGGIHDQLGGGFARYSVDSAWLVPHFEKMLYDNAQLAMLYLDASLARPNASERHASVACHQSGLAGTLALPGDASERHSAVACDILDYVLRDMTHPEGGFYSAEDADSEGHEGKFYCWTRAQLATLLTPDEFNVAVRHFGVTEEGNFVDHSHPQPLHGQNVLSVVDPRLSDDEKMLLGSAKEKMFNARATRVRPHLDDKVLASWNGLMLGAMARASAALGHEKYLAAARKNLTFLQARLWQPAGLGRGAGAPSDSGARAVPARSTRDSSETSGSSAPAPSCGTLWHRWRDGERDDVQLLEGYAFLLAGVIELYEAALEPEHLEFAIKLADSMIAKFYDAEDGGFWQSPVGQRDLIVRIKDDYDGAEPSGNSVATLALLKLAAITGRGDLRQPAEATLRLFAARMEKIPQAVPFMLHALDFWMNEPRRIVVSGDPTSAQTRRLLRAVHSVYQPNKVVLGTAGAVEPFAKTLPSNEGATVYVCTGTSCQPPTSNPAEVQRSLAL